MLCASSSAGSLSVIPKLKFLLGHTGETLPYLLWRLPCDSVQRRRKALKPAEIIRRNVAITTAGMFSDSPLLCALRELGEDAVMFSVDHPFESMATAFEMVR